MTGALFDKNPSVEPKESPGSKQRIFVLGIADDVDESWENLQLIFETLGFPNSDLSGIKFVSDCKLLSIMLGIQGCSSTHPCPYGECFMELDGEKRGTCSRWTEWKRGTVRTLANLQSNYEAWCAETGEDKKRLPDYKSCQYPPIDLYGWEYQDEKILVLYTPMPLHLLLGSGNSCLRMLEDTYQDFHKFYEMWGVSKVSFDFSGRDLKVLLSDDCLQEMNLILGDNEDSHMVVDYLAAILRLYRTCVQKDLGVDMDWLQDVDNFKVKFRALHLNENFRLRESLKIHILCEHLQDYFILTGETLAQTNDEFCESAHSYVRRQEEKHGLRMTKQHSGSRKRMKSLRLITIVNEKNKKFKR